ncbi:hypothetical protein ACUIAC_00945 [Dermabacteraceae bacterium P13138]
MSEAPTDFAVCLRAAQERDQAFLVLLHGMETRLLEALIEYEEESEGMSCYEPPLTPPDPPACHQCGQADYELSHDALTDVLTCEACSELNEIERLIAEHCKGDTGAAAEAVQEYVSRVI